MKRPITDYLCLLGNFIMLIALIKLFKTDLSFMQAAPSIKSGIALMASICITNIALFLNRKESGQLFTLGMFVSAIGYIIYLSKPELANSLSEAQSPASIAIVAIILITTKITLKVVKPKQHK